MTGLCTVPLSVPLDQIRFEEDGPAIDNSINKSEIEIEFKDTPGVSNFYEVSALHFEENFGFEPFYSVVFGESLDPATTTGINYASLILDDLSFEGEIKNLSIIIDKQNIQTVEEKLYLSWRVTTEDHFLFNKSTRAQIDQEGNPFASPVQVFSNMENGIGIFSIVNENIIKVGL